MGTKDITPIDLTFVITFSLALLKKCINDEPGRQFKGKIFDALLERLAKEMSI